MKMQFFIENYFKKIQSLLTFFINIYLLVLPYRIEGCDIKTRNFLILIPSQNEAERTMLWDSRTILK